MAPGPQDLGGRSWTGEITNGDRNLPNPGRKIPTKRKGRREVPSCPSGAARPCYGVVELKVNDPSAPPFTNVMLCGVLLKVLKALYAVTEYVPAGKVMLVA